MKIKIMLVAILVVLSSCKYFGHGDDEKSEPPQVLGLNYTESEIAFEETYANLRNSIEANPNIKIVAEVDHSMNAASVDLKLNPTKEIFFGNPNLGTPLMQKNQLAGLDLPQKILVYQNDLDEVYLAFNNTEYLASRHALEGVATLPMIEGALTNLTTNAGQGSIMTAEKSDADLEQGIVTKVSVQSFEDSYNSLRNAIDNNPNLKIIAELDHQANAASVDKELRPTRIIIFGNPKLGTPLMQNAQTVAIDLPQKMLVWEDADGAVNVSYNDPDFLAERHGITGIGETLQTITGALDNLSNVAVGNQ